MPAERLQKIIAAAGVASRRKAEELITSGRVLVNGQPVTLLGSKADPEQDHIRVDGKLLHAPEHFSYIALNKPKGYVTTVSDPEKRPTVMDLVRQVKGRVYPVGRLDWASEGLLLLTNDGALANALMKAASHVPKIYVVKVAGVPDETKLDKLRGGISIAEKGGRRVRTAPAQIRLIREGDNPWLEVTIIEGRNRQVRKMFEEVGHHVEKIRRVQYGSLSLDVPPGEFRSLTLEEVAKLKSAASGTGSAKSMLPPSRAISPPKPAFARKPPAGQKRSFSKTFPKKRKFAPKSSSFKKSSFDKSASFGRKPFDKKSAPAQASSFEKTASFDRNPARDRNSSFDRNASRTQRPSFKQNSESAPRPSLGEKPFRGGKPSFGKKRASSSARSFDGKPSRTQKPSFGDRTARPERPSFDRKSTRSSPASFKGKSSRTQKPARFQKRDRKR
jgi:23S rRNA pseudouridine2605 synthase